MKVSVLRHRLRELVEEIKGANGRSRWRGELIILLQQQQSVVDAYFMWLTDNLWIIL